MSTIDQAQALNVALSTARVLTTQLQACAETLPVGPMRSAILDMKTVSAETAESLEYWARHAKTEPPAILTGNGVLQTLNAITAVRAMEERA